VKGLVVDWQLTLTVILVALAGAYVLRAVVRPLFGRGGAGCGSGCGKCAAPEPAPVPGRIGLPQLPSTM
jgi:hypothetical protein